jgi:hypothetical protein
MIATKADFARALERLKRRHSESLAAFIMSLAQDSGPIGEQVRTFIVGDDVAETVESVQRRIEDLRTPTERDLRYALGREIGERMGFILDSIERLVLPADPKGAFELLVSVFAADAVAMENCGDHHFEVSLAFERAVGLLAEAAQCMPQSEVITVLEPLLNDDGYGVRGPLGEVIATRGEKR